MKIRRLEAHVNEGPEALARVEVEFPSIQEALEFLDAFREGVETEQELCQSDSESQ